VRLHGIKSREAHLETLKISDRELWTKHSLEKRNRRLKQSFPPIKVVSPSVKDLEHLSDKHSVSVTPGTSSRHKQKQTGKSWMFDRPFPITKSERKVILKKRQWRKLPRLPPYGEYKVFPTRDCINMFTKQFNASYEIQGLMSLISDNTDQNIPDIQVLIKCRNFTLRYLGNNSKEVTIFQRKILASIHYLIRLAKRMEKVSLIPRMASLS